jgi:predicted dienelactone hydrolase
MRILESSIFVVVLIALAFRLILKLRGYQWAKYLPFIALVLIPMQIVFEGYRWQMMPIFVFALGYSVFAVFDLRRGNEQKYLISQKILRSILIVVVFLLLLGAFIFPALLPVVDLPEPTGPHAVGTTVFSLVDEARQEVFSAESGDYRTLVVAAWYPAADVSGLKPVNYWDDEGITGEAYSLSAEIGTYWYTHLNLVQTNSFRDVMIAKEDQSYPVIMYSHSFNGLNTENTILFEELASQGYVVLSIAHSYEAIVSISPDGEVIYADLDYIFDLYEYDGELESELWDEFYKIENETRKTEIIQQVLGMDEEASQMLRARTEDAIFLLDELTQINADVVYFDGKLDGERVGIMGYSFGGATAVEACIADQRFIAGMNLDGWPYGAFFNSGQPISQPFMLINAEAIYEDEIMVSDLIFTQMEGEGYRLNISGTDHGNFWDFPHFFNIYKYLGYWMPIDSAKMSDIMSTYSIEFFDMYLKGENSEVLLDDYSIFPEVIFSKKE